MLRKPLMPADIKDLVHQIDEAIAGAVDGDIRCMHMSIDMALTFKDFLQTLDPDMPARPIMAALGPLVGDQMMNDKLNRLNDIADKLGAGMMLMTTTTIQLEGIVKRATR